MMSRRRFPCHLNLPRILRRFAREEQGTTLVELAVVTPIFFVMFLGMLDFGRMGAEYVMAQKAVQIAGRIAIVRSPACPNVPQINERGPAVAGQIAPRYGTMCSAGASVCRVPPAADLQCRGTLANPTVAEIWTRIRPLLPVDADVSDLHFNYEYTSDMGFLGGPYVPRLHVELRDLQFRFATPVGTLLTLAGGVAGSVPGPTLTFPTMTTSFPGEDLAVGNNG